MREPSDRLLPIFPLSSVVLFPKVRVPLHIFEPRYRAMTRYALDGDRRIGMVTVLPEHHGDLAGDPPVYAIGCEGSIQHAVRLPDGRYNIVLEGVARIRILEEPPRPEGQLYRSVRADRLGEGATGEALAAVHARRGEIVDLLMQLVRRLAPDRADEISTEQFARIDDETFVNSVAQAVELPLPDKQSLLEANGVSARCELLVSLLRFRLAERQAGSPADRRVLH